MPTPKTCHVSHDPLPIPALKGEVSRGKSMNMFEMLKASLEEAIEIKEKKERMESRAYMAKTILMVRRILREIDHDIDEILSNPGSLSLTSVHNYTDKKFFFRNMKNDIIRLYEKEPKEDLDASGYKSLFNAVKNAEDNASEAEDLVLQTFKFPRVIKGKSDGNALKALADRFDRFINEK